MENYGKKILVTGATGGIGRETAKILAENGYELLLAGRSEKKLNNILKSLSGESHEIVVADLTSQNGIEKLKKSSEKFYVNGLINCLGVNMLSSLSRSNEDDIKKLIDVNLVAPINICRALLTILLKQPYATVINVGSIQGSIGCAGSSIYCASKFGLRGFTESLRRELADTGVSVIYLAPRATNTTLNSDAANKINKELGNTIDEPSIVAKKMFLLLESGKPINYYISWPEYFFVLLNSNIPSIVDKYMAKKLPAIRRHYDLEP